MVDVRRERRAKRSLGEENGDIFESVMIRPDFRFPRVTGAGWVC